MRTRLIRSAAATLSLTAAFLIGSAAASADPGAPAHHPLYMPDVQNIHNPALQPPPICCVPNPGVALGVPAPVNMAYFGGHVQVTPKVYLVFWGWGQAGAFDHTTPGMPANDPDGAAARMTSFIKAIGGTQWAGVQTQYYMTANAQNTYITNPSNQLGGTWYDDTNAIHNNVTGLELAQEAQRAVAHFGVTDLKNSQFIIAQPQKFNEKGFNDGVGYCACTTTHSRSTTPESRPGSPSRTCRTSSSRAPAAASTPSTTAITPASWTGSRSCSATKSRRPSPTRAPRT